MSESVDEYVDEYVNVALRLVKKVGYFMTEHVSDCESFVQKSCDIDLVTEVNMDLEDTLIGELKAYFPRHKFIGKETVSSGGKCELTDDPTWIIDPVNGTMNFIHGFPHSCISVGLAINKEAVAGIIYNPMLHQLFVAMKGQGAFYNDQQIHVSQTKELGKALIAFEAGTSRDAEKRDVVFQNFKMVVDNAHGVRCLGSAALNMAMVALGGADANFEFGIHAWDIAAGDILVREAGGVCIDPAGGKLDLLARRVLCAATPELAQALVASLAQFYPEHD